MMLLTHCTKKIVGKQQNDIKTNARSASHWFNMGFSSSSLAKRLNPRVGARVSLGRFPTILMGFTLKKDQIGLLPVCEIKKPPNFFFMTSCRFSGLTPGLCILAFSYRFVFVCSGL